MKYKSRRSRHKSNELGASIVSGSLGRTMLGYDFTRDVRSQSQRISAQIPYQPQTVRASGSDPSIVKTPDRVYLASK
jgi:hypothetical protein